MHDRPLEITMPAIIDSLFEKIFSPDRLESLADFLDSRFRLPCVPMRFGWDFIIGLVPVAGDILSALVSGYIILAALYHRAGIFTVARMLANVLLDLLIGLVPVIGDLFDIAWKANTKNVRLLIERTRMR